MSLVVEGEELRATVARLDANRIAVEVAGAPPVVFEDLACDPGSLRFRRDGIVEQAVFARDARGLWLQWRGRSRRIDDTSRTAPARRGLAAADGKLRAAMAGRVVALLARPGERVEAGAPLLTLEAMKMEHSLVAPFDGIVAELEAAEGAQVSEGALLARIEKGEG